MGKQITARSDGSYKRLVQDNEIKLETWSGSTPFVCVYFCGHWEMLVDVPVSSSASCTVMYV